MDTYIYSAAWCFIFGSLGASVFLFMMLLFDKNIEVLENDTMPKLPMGLLYIALGGIVALVIGTAPDFDFAQIRIAFGAGFAWPAVATGIGSGQLIGKLSRRREATKELAIAFQNQGSKAKEAVAEYYRGRLERAQNYINAVIERSARERDEMQVFYQKQLENAGGDS